MRRSWILLLLAYASTAGAAGRSGQPGPPATLPAYYDGQLFTINFTELPPGGETATEAHNNSKNTIYQCDACAGQINGGDFISVLDAIQGDGFNPLWEEFQITFLTISPQQFTSDNAILAAFGRGEINLTDTNEMYTCAVLGPKK